MSKGHCLIQTQECKPVKLGRSSKVFLTELRCPGGGREKEKIVFQTEQIPSEIQGGTYVG